MFTNTTGQQNTAFGRGALYSSNGDSNILLDIMFCITLQLEETTLQLELMHYTHQLLVLKTLQLVKMQDIVAHHLKTFLLVVKVVVIQFHQVVTCVFMGAFGEQQFQQVVVIL